LNLIECLLLAEYRLQLREDNADLRLTEIGRNLGVVEDHQWESFSQKRETIFNEVERLKKVFIHPGNINGTTAEALFSAPLEREYSLHDILKRPEFSYESLEQLPNFGGKISDDERICEQIAIQIKYAGYIARQHDEVGKLAYLDEIKLAPNIDYSQISGLSAEVVQKLTRFVPENIGQAARISGITPAAISLLQVYAKKGFPLK
ncbi:MAG: hypothetical protein RLZZ293_770, partial [Pseudomonadota bacterium]